MNRPRLALAFAVALASAGVCGVARADEPAPADSAAEARQQYGLGTQAFKEKRYTEAALHFEAAASFKANAIALYTAGLAWDLAARPERAADAYARALDVPGLDDKKATTARDRLEKLERGLGTAVVTAPEGWKVQLDTFSEVRAPVRLHGAPGVHVLTARAPNKTIQRRDIALEAGRAIPVELKEEARPSPKPEPEPVVKDEKKEPAKAAVSEPLPPRLREQQFWNNYRVAGVGVGALGVAALGAGIILGTSANDAGDAYNAAPTRASFDHASSLQTWTNVSFVSGVVLVAGGVALIVLPLGERMDGRVRVGATPGGLVIGGEL